MLLKEQQLRHKAFLKAKKRLDEVRVELKGLPLRELQTPFQKGWEVTIRLREDATHRKDAAELLEAISIGYQPLQLINSLKDIKMIRSGKKGYSYHNGHHVVYVDFVPHKKRLTIKQYDALAPGIKKYFYKIEEPIRWSNMKIEYYSVFIPDYYICLKARPNMITHYRLKGGPLEKEEKELEDFLDTYWREWFGDGKYLPDPHTHRRTQTRIQTKKFLKGEVEDIVV